MRILLIGSGGREHALAWKIVQSPRLTQLYTLPGNPGTAQVSENIPGNFKDLEAVVVLALQREIDLVVVGPEDPLAAGLADKLREANIPVFGPSAAAAQIEASKAFAKSFMQRYDIPTGTHKSFTDFDVALAYIHKLRVTNHQFPVIKVSGLAAGKGVFLPDTLDEAEVNLRAIMVEGIFAEAGEEVVVEERLIGPEVSLLAFTDGKTVEPMPPAQDHKRLLDNDQGPNTGGMGVFTPSPFAPPELVDQIAANVLQPAVDGMRAEGHAYVGVLYAGMILTADGPKVLEFNCRFGDPETQVILPLLETDLVDIMMACVDGCLAEFVPKIQWREAATVCVVLAADGYPGSYPKGLPITGLETLPEEIIAFHAGTDFQNGTLCTSGGRVLGITGIAQTLEEAKKLAYAGVAQVHFDGMHHRKDIAADMPNSPITNCQSFASAQDRSPVTSPAYAAAGVDIEAGNRAVSLMKEAIKATYGPEVLSDVGTFGGLFSAKTLKDLNDPVLVGTMDSVGTKVMLSARIGRYDSIGHDLVNHCINDILVQGARPLFFMDYFASSRLNPEQVTAIVKGMAEACREAGCALLGGETAEMPGVYADGHFDVVGSLIGIVDRPKILPRQTIQPGDLLLGFTSSGPHTNGYTLIRRVFADVPLDTTYPELDLPLADALLALHRSYLSILEPLITNHQLPITGLAHITGGGFYDNIPRILPYGCGAQISRGSWPVPPIFDLIQRLGNVGESEMYHVFNMGIGMVAVIAPADESDVRAAIPEETWVIGEVVEGGDVKIV